MKKLLAILLSVTMLLGCIVVSVSATGSDEKVATIEFGEKYELNALEYATLVEDDWNPTYTWTTPEGLNLLCNFLAGDYVEYKINVLEAETYDFSVFFACMWEDNYFTFYVDGVEAGKVNHYASKFIDLDHPVWTDPTPIELTEGEHTIKLTFAGGCQLWGIGINSGEEEPEAPAGIEVEVDHKGVAEGHGLTITNGVGGLSLSYQFKTTAAFKAFSAKLGYLEAGKYFNVSITERGSDEPIQTWTSNGFNASIGSVAWVSFELDEALTAGEYIVIISPESGLVGDILWKRYDVQDDYGIWESVGSFAGEKPVAATTTPAFKVTFTEEVADGKYFAKAGEVVEPEETVAPETTAPAPEDTAAPETTAPEDTAAPETTAPETEAPVEPEAPTYEVAVDNKGATEDHGLTMTTGVGYLGLSYQFKTTAAFNAFSAKLGFFAADRTISVTITKIGSDEPIQTWLKTGDPDIIPDNYWGDPIGQSRWVTFELDEELPAGEYIIQMGPAEGQPLSDVIWKKYSVKDELGIFESVSDTFDWEKETARNSTPCFKVTFTEEVADGNYFAKAGEVEPEQTYVYINSLDGSVVSTLNAPLTEVDAATLAKLNAYANGTYNTFVKFELLSEEDGTYTFVSVHNTEADVTVNGGEAEEKDGYYILTADAPEEGQYFAGWYIGDVLLSYSETFKFFPNVATVDLVAKYDTEAPAKNSNVGVEVDRTSDKLTVSVFPIYGDNAIVEFGYYVATSTEPMDAAAVIANGKKLDSHAPHAYMVRVHDITEVTKYKHIYVVGYYTYVDGEGETKTVYTDVVTRYQVESKVIIDSDEYTYSNSADPQWVTNPTTESGVAGFDGNCLRFKDTKGTMLGFHPDGANYWGFIRYNFEAGATYKLSFDFKMGDELVTGGGHIGCVIGGQSPNWIFYFNSSESITNDTCAIEPKLTCIDEANDIWHYEVSFAITTGTSVEFSQNYEYVDLYMDNIVLEKVA